jgi:DNA-binding transcriptional MocR family regulator
MNKQRKSGFAYQAVYRYLSTLVNEVAPGTRKKLPSLRDLSRRLKVSISTIQYAYSLLESEGRVYSVAKSGYFAQKPGSRRVCQGEQDLLQTLQYHANRPDMLVLSRVDPSALMTLDNSLLMLERELLRQNPRWQGNLRQPCGELELRAALAARYTRSAQRYWCADDVYIGVDVRAVLEIMLHALELRGGTVLVSSPCSWMVLRVLQAAGVRVIELPLCQAGRLDLEHLKRLLRSEPVRLVLLCSGVNAPQGSLMPESDKHAIARLLELHGAWLLENDLDGEFCFVDEPGHKLRDLVNPDRLLVFSSLERIVGPEAPYGYLLSRHFSAELQRHFLLRSFRMPPIRQRAIARLYRKGRIDLHLQQIRVHLQERLQALAAQLQAHLGEQLQLSVPMGGAGLWARAREPVVSRRVFERLLEKRIVVAPGEIFSLQGLHHQYFRLGLPQDGRQDLEWALRVFGEVLRQERLA